MGCIDGVVVVVVLCDFVFCFFVLFFCFLLFWGEVLFLLFFSFFFFSFNIHQRGVLTVLTGCCMAGAT